MTKNHQQQPTNHDLIILGAVDDQQSPSFINMVQHLTTASENFQNATGGQYTPAATDCKVVDETDRFSGTYGYYSNDTASKGPHSTPTTPSRAPSMTKNHLQQPTNHNLTSLGDVYGQQSSSSNIPVQPLTAASGIFQNATGGQYTPVAAPSKVSSALKVPPRTFVNGEFVIPATTTQGTIIIPGRPSDIKEDSADERKTDGLVVRRKRPSRRFSIAPQPVGRPKKHPPGPPG
jgi:hypothetical protein